MKTTDFEKLPLDFYVPELATKKDMVDKLYPGLTIDYALPQRWVDNVQARGFGDHVSGHFVTGYFEGNAFPVILPVTPTGVYILAVIATHSA